MADKFKYSDSQLKELLDGIYNGSITKYAIPEDLYFAIADYLKSGLYKGFGGSLADFGGKDLELLKELRENVYMFSGGKAYHQIDEISSLLLDAEGKRRSMLEFTRLGAGTFETWNDAWGRTEYNTAVSQGAMAVKWNEIQQNKDLLPILTYMSTEVACPICAPLDGVTAPVSDPIWRKIMPINHFNCNCTVRQYEAGTKLTPTDEKDGAFKMVTKKMDDTFLMNPGIDKVIFSEKHPYFTVPKADTDYAKNNFNLPIPAKD